MKAALMDNGKHSVSEQSCQNSTNYPLVSIIIVHWNGSDMLQDCLESIENTTYRSLPIEVIIIFNGSTDGSQKMCADKFPWVNRIENAENNGFNAGNNQGIVVSQGKFVLLLNDDTIVFPGAIEKLVAYLDCNSDVGIVGPKLLNVDGSLQRSCHQFPSLVLLFTNALFFNKLFPRSKWFGKSGMTYWNYAETQSVDWLMGACMLLRKDVAQQVGLLDSRIKVAGDYDLCWRFWKAGWKVVFVHDAEIIHLMGKSSVAAEGPQAVERRASTMYLNYEAMYFFFRDHYGLRRAQVAVVIRKVSVAIRGAISAVVLTFARDPNLGLAMKAQRDAAIRILACSLASLEDTYQHRNLARDANE